MTILNKVRDLFSVDDEYEDEYEEEIEEEVQPVKKYESRNSFVAPKPEGAEAKLPTIQQSRTSMAGASSFKMVVIEPKNFDDSPKLVDNLKARKPVIINLENIETMTAKKIFDFLSGATYALGGNVQRVAPNIFVFTPENVDIATNIESGGLDFSGTISKSNWR